MLKFWKQNKSEAKQGMWSFPLFKCLFWGLTCTLHQRWFVSLSWLLLLSCHQVVESHDTLLCNPSAALSSAMEGCNQMKDNKQSRGFSSVWLLRWLLWINSFMVNNYFLCMNARSLYGSLSFLNLIINRNTSLLN